MKFRDFIFKKRNTMTEKDKRWNLFIEDICSRELSELSPIQKDAVLCFWYDAEMNGGGHAGYFECYPNTVPEELAVALTKVAGKEFADNYRKALEIGEEDDYEETDDAFYSFLPELSEYLAEYVEKNKEEIFE